ncbi:MAG: DNA polymerase III subunit delta' [Bacteroidetes bacterium]|nr:MAG: DNA polymerase III subunit delta' [Bacteroidota bacterium]
MFKKIKGQEKAILILERSIKQNKIAQSYLFYGPDGVGKFTTALYFGMAINCHSIIDKRPCGVCNSCKKFLSFSHPDLVYIFPTPKLDISLDGEIKSNAILVEYNNYLENKKKTPWKEFFFSQNIGIRIGSIRMLEHRINLSPNEAVTKIYIIENADMMTRQAANAFLKTLEEPPRDTVIILTTSKPNSLLPTILSRCQKISFSAIPKNIIEKELRNTEIVGHFEAKIYARIANGSMEKALRLVEEGLIKSREETIKFLKIILNKNDLHFLEFVNHYKTSKNQTKLVEIISHLILWVSDISYYKNYPDDLINLDQTDLLEILYHNNPKIDEYAPELIEFLEEMIQRLAGYVNPQLILTEIYHRLCSIFSSNIITS